MHAKETAARPLLSAVLVYGQFDLVNKAASFCDNNSLSERQREGHPELNELQRQPFFFDWFLLGGGVAGPSLSGTCSKRGRAILAQQAVRRVNWPGWAIGSIQPGSACVDILRGDPAPRSD